VCDTEVSEFSFASGSTKLQLDIDKLQFNGDAEVEIDSDFVSKVCVMHNNMYSILYINPALQLHTVLLKCNVELTHICSL